MGGSPSLPCVVFARPSIILHFSIILRERSYKVQEAASAFEALEMIRKNPSFDLVLTDVIMPQMSGTELGDVIKKRIPKTKVLFMSGYTDDALAHHGILDAGILFLEKPFSPSRLTRKVREVLDAPEPALARQKCHETATLAFTN